MDQYLLLFAIMLAGAVRGFSGFGGTLTFVPLASRIMPPHEAIVVITLVDSIAGLVLIPSAVQQAEHKRVFGLALGAWLTIPVGAFMLATLDVTLIRWILSVIIGVSVLALASGWRYQRMPTIPAALGIGAIAGIMGGIGGLFGPAVMVFLSADDSTAMRNRANIIVFLAWMLLITAAAYVYFELFDYSMAVKALLLSPAYFFGVLGGVWIFKMATDIQYRRVVYCIIGASAILGLPIFDSYIN